MILSDLSGSGSYCGHVGCWFNGKHREDVCITFDVAPVPLTLEDLTDPTSPGIVVCCADKEFDMIELDSGHDEI
jgi:hypothetical protein